MPKGHRESGGFSAVRITSSGGGPILAAWHGSMSSEQQQQVVELIDSFAAGVSAITGLPVAHIALHIDFGPSEFEEFVADAADDEGGW